MHLIRDAVEADFSNIISAIRSLVEGSSYADYDQVNADHVNVTLQALIKSPDACVLVLEDEGAFGGVFIGMAHPHLFSGARMCGELFVWVRPDLRGHGKELKHKAEQWARDQNCQSMTFSFPESEAHLDPVYRKWGYTPLERSYRKELT